MMTTAKVIEWTDGDCADVFEDEHGFKWKYVVDAMDGTIAVQSDDSAGVFRWEQHSKDTGHIGYSSNGDTYDVGNPAEFIVIDDVWERNDA